MKPTKEIAIRAINLAMESRWEEAIEANRALLELAPEDVEAWNRLGKSLSELGHYSEAREAFKQALRISPSNSIAKKNLERIGLLTNDAPQRPTHQRVPPNFFIEETGKTGVTSLVDMAPKEALARAAAGEPVYLESQEHKLLAKNGHGEYLGTVQPKLGLRLLRLIRGGNRYTAAITSITDQDVRVIIKESFQHSSQRGRISFPPRGVDNFRPYVWEGLFRYGEEEEETVAEAGDDWGEGREHGLDEVLERRRPSRRRRELLVNDEEEG